MICDGYIDLNTSVYSSYCASQMLNISSQDYNFIMALLGGLTGLFFISSTIYIIFNIGKSYKA